MILLNISTSPLEERLRELQCNAEIGRPEECSLSSPGRHGSVCGRPVGDSKMMVLVSRIGTDVSCTSLSSLSIENNP